MRSRFNLLFLCLLCCFIGFLQAEQAPERPSVAVRCFTGTAESIVRQCQENHANCCQDEGFYSTHTCNWDASYIKEVEVCEGSCTGTEACVFTEVSALSDSPQEVSVQQDSCKGYRACAPLGPKKITFGPMSCIGDEACNGAEGAIGPKSCIGEGACAGAEEDIGSNSCIGIGACNGAEGAIGSNSCIGLCACEEAYGAIGSNSCIGFWACDLEGGDVGDGSCTEKLSCSGTGSVGDGSCTKDFDAAEDKGACQYADCVGDHTESCGDNMSCGCHTSLELENKA